MLRSLLAGISGLRAHQQMMDVTGNNIANVNTVGFKSSQSIFEDTLSQMLIPSAAPRGGFGGVNPAQVGLGTRLAAIVNNFTQGSAQTTGRTGDLMVSGDGFFILSNNTGTDQVYSRAGAFAFDLSGRLVNPEGLAVQGWTATNGTLDPTDPVGDILLPAGSLPPARTTTVSLGGNLPADTTSTAPIVQQIQTYDQQGNEIMLRVTWTRNTALSWDVAVTDGTATLPAQTITFGATGSTPSSGTLSFSSPTVFGAAPITIDISGVTSFAGESTLTKLSSDGTAMGSLTGYTISKDGVLTASYSNGVKQPFAQIALANFTNANGLEKTGESTFRQSVASGQAVLGQPGSGTGRGVLQSGSLEMSNVDLGQEFTNLIVAQRGFQANSKVISVSDELLQDLVNLKR